ncbi:MAG: DUF7681 family protein [Vitreimonas sp.]
MSGENVFEGAPDARQSDDTATPVSRFRPRYRALTAEEKALHDEIKAKAEELDALISKVWSGPVGDMLSQPADFEANKERAATVGRYKSLAVTSLEQSIMWAIKALTA